ncbi:MAG: cytochrome c peroxidase [Raineya sp.]|nr:cytochrome c peroxidase [Raineya sp.]
MNWRTYFLLMFISFAFACRKTQEQKPDIYASIRFEKPQNFPEPHYKINENPPTPAGFKLGKALFYDGLLSRDGTISCGTCHQQPFAFTHHEHDVSHGIDDKLGIRNAPSLQNLAWHKEFNWDGGVNHLDFFPIQPIENPVEMDEKLSNVLQKLRNHATYPKLFKEAFGSEEITTERFLKALSQFMVMMISADSKYDRYLAGKASLSADELAGLQVFQNKCSACHQGVLFTDLSYRDNGLPPTSRNDTGRERITLNPTDRYKFKVPSLRNVAVTRPYMHDGRFSTLEQVLNHYQNGVRNNPNLDNLLRKPNGTLGIDLTETEKRQIIAFLQTLTDENFLKDERFSEFNNTIK